jgi:uncharacterized protein YbaA (DUF1428 family)
MEAASSNRIKCAFEEDGMPYVDGFLLPVPKKNLAVYRKMAAKAGKIWMEHGALGYHECAGDDLVNTFGVSFPKTLKVKRNETVVLSWIMYKSKAERNRVNKKVMNDPRIKADMAKPMPFEVKRMAYGGFKTIVDLGA